MNVQQAILQRRSIRKYKDIPVSDEHLAILLEAARLAPTGSNTQTGRFIVVRGDEMRKKVAEVSHDQKWMTRAPLFIVCVSDPTARIPEGLGYLDEESTAFELKQSIRDVAIQAEHIVLQAEELGLGTCWIAWFIQEEIRPVLGIPEDKFVVAVLIVGHPDEAPAARPRMALNDIACDEKWGW